MNIKKLTEDNYTEDLLMVLEGLKERIISGDILPGKCTLNAVSPESFWFNGEVINPPAKVFVFTLEYLSMNPIER